jgi:hypothetical protein
MVSKSDPDQNWSYAGLPDIDIMLNYMPDSQPATGARTVFFTSLWQCYWVTHIETDLYHVHGVQPVPVSPLTAVHYLAHRFVAVMSAVCSCLQIGHSFMRYFQRPQCGNLGRIVIGRLEAQTYIQEETSRGFLEPGRFSA